MLHHFAACTVITWQRRQKTHPLHTTSISVRSGRRHLSISARTARYSRSFVPSAIRALNSWLLTHKVVCMNYSTIYTHVHARSFVYQCCVCIKLSIFFLQVFVFVTLCRSFIKCTSMFCFCFLPIRVLLLLLIYRGKVILDLCCQIPIRPMGKQFNYLSDYFI